MGFKEVGRVLKHSKATGTAKVILLAIAHHDGPGGAWPSHELLAEYANVDERNARRAVKKLVDDGELRIHVKRGGSDERPDGFRPNLYEVLVDCPAACDGSEHHRMPRLSRKRGEGATAPASEGATVSKDEGATSPPELSTEPPLEYPRDPEDQDFESRRISRLKPTTAAEKADRRRLAQHMANCVPSDVDLVWGWMRTGHSLSGRDNSEIDRPGSAAAKLHRKIADSGLSEWQGWFRRHYLSAEQRDRGIIPTAASDDPWSTTKSA